MDILAQLIVNGLIAGGIYALAAIGYNLVYGVLKFINFAHGSVAMVGAYVAFALAVNVFKLNLVVAFCLCMAFTAVLGVLLEMVAYRPLRRRRAPKIATLTTSIAASFVLDAAVMLVFGTDLKTFGLPATSLVRVGSVGITTIEAVIIVASLLFMVGIYALLSYTKVGKAIRAVADDVDLAEVAGINANVIISVVFATGSALAAASGALIGMETSLQPTMGFAITIKGFAAVVLGGLGSVPGAIVGGFVIGLAENLGTWYIPTVWKDSISYGILILMLIVRPAGLLGKKEDTGGTVL